MNLGTLEQHVLFAVLAQHPNAYGVSIRDHISKRAGINYSIGSIYATLARLEEKGFVRSKEGEKLAERGGRAKLHFTITATGQASLQQSIRAAQALQRGLRWREAFLEAQA